MNFKNKAFAAILVSSLSLTSVAVYAQPNGCLNNPNQEHAGFRGDSVQRLNF